MKRATASGLSFLATAVSLPVWAAVYGHGTLAWMDVKNPAGLAILTGACFALAIPFGLLVGYVTSPLIYSGCDQSGLRRCGRAVGVHVGVVAALGVAVVLFTYFHQRTEFWEVVGSPIALSFIFAPWLGLPSLIGTLVYAYRSSPAVRDTAA
jgi:hypothetical protein